MNHEHASDCCRQRRGGLGTAILGFGIAAFGLTLTLDNLDLVDSADLLPYWPVLLMILGVSYITRPSATRCLGTGLVWIAIGAVILLDNLGYIGFAIWDLWPLLLVILGLNLLRKAFRRRRSVHSEEVETFEATAILGGVTRRIGTSDFRGGDATAVLGGCEIDLTESGSSGGPAEIGTFALWGGIDIRVPRDWEVQIKGTAILGAFEDKTIPSGGPVNKVLIIRGTAIMASVEVKS